MNYKYSFINIDQAWQYILWGKIYCKSVSNIWVVPDHISAIGENSIDDQAHDCFASSNPVVCP